MDVVVPNFQLSVSGHVYKRGGARGPVWYAKYRVPDATAPGGIRQVKHRLGPEWPEKGSPPPGYFDRRKAQAALEAMLTDARRGAVEVLRTGVSFERAARDWLAWGEHERGWKRSTLVDRRSCLERHLLPAFGSLRIDQLTAVRIERWKMQWLAERGQRRQCAKLLSLLHSIFERAVRLYGLPRNPVIDVSRIKIGYDAGRFDFYSPEEVYALARAADDEQDAALFLTAAFAGLRRGELIALRWRDVDFTKAAIRVEGSYGHGEVSTTKGGRSRVVPMVNELAAVLARLGQRCWLAEREDPVFPGEAGGFMDGSTLRRRYVEARRSRRPAAAALSRPAPHLRLAGDQPRQHRSGPGVDGARRLAHDHALPAPQEPGGEAELLAGAFRPAGVGADADQLGAGVGEEGP